MTRPTALYDASVLYPSLIRNLLMHLATAGLVSARWTDAIHDEWTRNLLSDRPELGAARLARTRQFMEAALPDASVTGYEGLIPTLHLPDPDDRHIFAAAITTRADIIVTWNLRHFPARELQPHRLEALSPDDLVSRLLVQSPVQTRHAVETLRLSLRHPPYTWDQLLIRLHHVGLVKTTRELAD